MKRNFAKQYGGKEGEKIFYATLNRRISEGRPIDSPESHKMAKKRKHGRHKRDARRSRR